MTPHEKALGACIGSVFLKSSNHDLCLAVLRALFGEHAVVRLPGDWLEVGGTVPLFMEPVPEGSAPAVAGFGIKVPDAAQAADALRGIPGLTVENLFDVAPDQAGFNCHGEGVPELFVHE